MKWIPAFPPDVVRVIDDFIEKHIDIGAFAEKYTNDEGGAPAKHPRILLKVLFYSYSQGIYSSREIEERISGGDSSFTYLSSNTFLDHSTICNFILKHEAAIRDIFTRMVYILHKFGLGYKLSKKWSECHFSGFLSYY